MNPYLITSRPLLSSPAACDPYFGNVVALLHFDGSDGSTTFTDVIGKTWTASGSAELDTTGPKFGTAAGLFNGTNSLISTPNNPDFHFGADDFTIEMWLDPTVLSGYATLFSIWDGADLGGRAIILYQLDDRLYVQYSTTGYDAVNSLFTAPVLSTSGGYAHVAIVRDGEWLRSYVNGVNCGAAGGGGGSADWFIGTTPILNGGTNPVCLGGQAPAAFGWYNGLMDDVRITKGVCRYPNATTFTPPDAAFYDVACTTGPGAHRYWRLYITDNDGSALYTGLTELRLKNAAGTIVSGYTFGHSGPAAYGASSVINETNSSFFAFDDDLTATGWLSATATPPQWVSFDLEGNGSWGIPVEIKSFDVYGSWNAPDASPKDFRLQWSDDFSSWTDALVVAGETGWSAAELRTFVVF